MRSPRTVLALALLLSTSIASAKSFPDVPKNSPHLEAVSQLSDLNVISGYPDGTFRPRDPINRAGLLKMLYIAAGIQPAPGATGCFRDVEKGSWYESYVCDAFQRGFVQGFENNTLFRPSRSVTRAEGLKLSVVVFSLPATGWPAQKQYLDVKRSDWYAPFLDAAVSNRMLPLPGQGQYTVFYGNLALSRGEAASFIWRARAWKQNPPLPTPSSASSAAVTSSSAVMSSSSAKSVVASSASSARSSSMISGRSSAPVSSTRSSVTSVASVASSGRPVLTPDELAAKRLAQQQEEKRRAELAKANTKAVRLPFVTTDTFTEKLVRTYRFVVPTQQTQDFTATVTSKLGSVHCRIFRLERDGVSVEYYLGFQEAQSCYLRVALQPGTYQLDVVPEQGATSVRVEAKAVTGDGNDGFAEAKAITLGQSRTDVLDANDLADWYTFTVEKTAPGLPIPHLRVSLVSTDGVPCLIYPLSDVDLFGFTAPQCNEPFAYPAGTYLVNIRHAAPRAARQAYTLSLLRAEPKEVTR